VRVREVTEIFHMVPSCDLTHKSKFCIYT